MLKVTKQAAQTLKNLLESNQVDPAMCFRMERQESNKFGFSLVSKDVAAEGERLLEWEGRKVLLLPQETSQALSGMALDAIANTEGEMKLNLVEVPAS